ncbi:MAG: hypothetical protein ACI9HE_002828 [Planctomycetota bacterium]|jgi:hypothetical protein
MRHKSPRSASLRTPPGLRPGAIAADLPSPSTLHKRTRARSLEASGPWWLGDKRTYDLW